jgi:predicted extracellular nuclease
MRSITYISVLATLGLVACADSLTEPAPRTPAVTPDASPSATSTPIFFNEIHYDNTGTDAGEAIEVAGPAGSDLTGWSVVLYNGANGLTYNTQALAGTIPDLCSGFGVITISYPTNGIQNGSPDGLALVDASSTVIQFLSYEGSFTAGDGPASGMASTDIGVSESSGTPVGNSLQLSGTGTVYEDFAWSADAPNTFGACNTGQTFGSGPPNVLINEVDADNPSTDAAEFIELFDGGGGNTALDGLVLVLYNGNGDVSYDAFDLDGQTTDANGFFVLCGDAANVANCDLDVVPNTNLIQNGQDAIGLYLGNATDFPSGTAVTTTDLIDAIVYDTNDPDDAGLLVLLNAGQPQVNEDGAGDKDNHSNQRIPNGSGGARNTDTYTQVPPTPGAVNMAPVVAISGIQGAGHISPFVGQQVTTGGIVTALAFNGYYVQDPVGDGDDDTSEGIFVFKTGSKPSVGDEVQLTDVVTEFIPGGAATGNLSITQLSFPGITVLSTGNPLPEPVILGRGGRIPPEVLVISPGEEPVNLQDPTQAAANPFNPDVDGIDFYESLEGMRVTVQDPVAVSGIRRFSGFSSEVFTLTDGGKNSTPNNARTERGGINLQPDPDNRGDQNPERVQIQFDGTLYPGTVPEITVGDRLRDVTGVVGYSFGNFEVNATEDVVVFPAGLQREVTRLVGRNNRVTVASYNVLNLSARSSDNNQRTSLGAQIVNNLRTPDIIALQEIQDNNGETNDGTTDASQTLQALVDAIVAAGGPSYAFFDVAPADGASGGAPGANIRNAFLYNPYRVTLVGFQSLTPAVLSPAGVGNPNAFNGSRDPLEATFAFGGEEFTVINNHLTSRFGSSPVFGAFQPFVQAGEAEREAQNQALNDYVDFLLAADKDARVIVLGDLNTFEFTDDLTQILPGAPEVVKTLLGENRDDNRYSFIFEGNSQVLDHVLATRSLLESGELDIVHANVDFPRVNNTVASDHEPLVARFRIR